jgi:predicted ATPase
MEYRSQITRVVFENYKSIAFCDVKLGPLSILVGPNGAGKSNFLDALGFLSEAVSGSIDNAFEKRGEVLRRGGESAGHLGFRIEFAAGYYSVRFRADGASGFIVEREKCVIDTHPQYEAEDGILKPESQLKMSPLGPSRVYLPFVSGPAFNLLNGCRFYNFSHRDIRQPVRLGHVQRILNSDGANLSSVLYHLRLSHRPVFERMLQYLRKITLGLDAVEPTELEGFSDIKFLFEEINGSFLPWQVSDGTIRSLAVLVALFQRLGGAETVSLVGLEEPETALHPAAAGVLFDAMREASASVQVIATTHSADLLDKKEIDTDAILAVEMEGCATRIGHVDETGRKALKERLYTAGELMRMNYLRPESSKTPDESEIESVLFGDLVPA